MVDAIEQIEAFPLNIPLLRPFTIATGRVDEVTNVAIRVRLSSGAVGWGEAAVLRPVTQHGQEEIIERVRAGAPSLIGHQVHDWRLACAEIAIVFKSCPSARSAVQMACLDAAATARGVPLWALFGPHAAQVETDITIPICPVEEAGQLALEYERRGFRVIKTKIGRDLSADIERIEAIRESYPGAQLLLDANEGFSADEALTALSRLDDLGMRPVLYEQPVHRQDKAGMARVTAAGLVPVAADESCRSLADAEAVCDGGLAQVLNIKFAKMGILEAISVVELARNNGLGLMVGAMVESRVGCGFAAHFVAGNGGVDWVDLDTALLLGADPVRGSYQMVGPRFDLSPCSAGQGIEGIKGIPS
jgi:L-alanine-DL-glutamate epimerase-like enolase superfamily enzyme